MSSLGDRFGLSNTVGGTLKSSYITVSAGWSLVAGFWLPHFRLVRVAGLIPRPGLNHRTGITVPPLSISIC